MRIMIKISRKILLMKKRILSLFLALAMVATAGVAVPGIQAEAAADASGTTFFFGPAATVDTSTAIGAGATTDAGVVANAPTIKIEGKILKNTVTAGDTLSVSWKKDGPDDNDDVNAGKNLFVASTDDFNLVAGGNFATSYGGFSGKVEYATAKNVNIQWIEYTKGKWHEIVGATDESFTVKPENVGNLVSFVIWMYDVDTTNVNNVNSIDDILLKLNDASPANNLGAARALPGSGDKIVGVAAKAIATAVQTSELPNNAIELESAYYRDGSNVVVVGNTIVARRSSVYGTSGGAIEVMTHGLALKFKASSDYKASDLWWKGLTDTANTTGGQMNNDSIIWGIAPQTNADRGLSSFAVGQLLQDGDMPNPYIYGINDVYDVYVKTATEGDLYNGTTKAYKTKYNLVVVPDGTLVVLDLNGGQLPESDRYRFQGAKAYNSVRDTTDTFAYRSVTSTNSQNERGDSDYYDLPKLPKKGDEFFQGWANTANGDVIPQTSNLVTRYDKLYHAVWGATEPKAEVAVGGQALYRLYNPNNGEHLYTPNASEVAALTPLGWIEEATTFNGLASGGQVVMRLYNPNSGEHHYVVNGSNEMNVLLAAGWLNDGNVFRTADAGVPMFRLWNGQAGPGSHHLTTDVNEYNTLATQGWRQEGAKFFGVK